MQRQPVQTFPARRFRRTHPAGQRRLATDALRSTRSGPPRRLRPVAGEARDAAPLGLFPRRGCPVPANRGAVVPGLRVGEDFPEAKVHAGNTGRRTAAGFLSAEFLRTTPYKTGVSRDDAVRSNRPASQPGFYAPVLLWKF